MKEGGLRYALIHNPIDCIVITGDIFVKGDVAQYKKTKKKIEEIYELCSNVCKWNWKIGEPMDRLFYCPGNHDFTRSTKRTIVKDGKKIEVSREEINCIYDYGYFAPCEEHYELLTTDTFGDISMIMDGLIEGKEISDLGSRSYEYHIYNAMGRNNTKVTFCAINTALNAAIMREKKDSDLPAQIRELYQASEEWEREYLKSRSGNDKITYLKKTIDYCLARVNKKQLNNDKGNLCFISEKAAQEIQDSIQYSPRQKNNFVIMMGHHPMEYLSKSAQEWMSVLSSKIGAKLYLCGHTHNPSGNDRIMNNVTEVRIGAFKSYDKDGSYGGFAIGSIVNENQKFTAVIKKWQYIPTHLGEVWIDCESRHNLS